MADFLPSLRMANIFGPNSDKSGFGQPKIDDGNVGSMLRQIVPLATSLNKDELFRRKELMRYGAELQRNPLEGRSRPINSSTPSGGSGPLTRSGAMPMNTQYREGGMSPIQQMWSNQRRENEVHGHKMELKNSELSGDYRREIDKQRIGDQSDMEQLLKEWEIRRAIEGDKTQANIAAADTAHGRAKELVGLRGDESRRTNAARPDTTPQSEMDASRGVDNRIQQLAIKNPEAAKFLVKDPNTQQWTISPNANPAQRKALTDYIYGK